MTKFIALMVMVLSFNVMADSNSTLKECVGRAVKVAPQAKATDYIKSINAGIRNCRQEVKAVVAQERAAKKKLKNAARIAKLQAQLSKLTSTK